MNLIHVTETFSLRGGTETYLFDLMERQERRGVRSRVVCGAAGEPVPHFGRERCHIVDGMSFESTVSVTVPLDRIMRVAADAGAQAIHVHSLMRADLLAALAREFPVLITAHAPHHLCPGGGHFFWNSRNVCELPVSWRCLLNAYREKCAPRQPKRLLRRSRNCRQFSCVAGDLAGIVTASAYMRRRVLQNGVVGECVHVIPYFLPEHEAFRDAQPVCGGGSGVLYVGRLDRTKGVDDLVGVIPDLPFDVEINIVGDGYYRSRLEREAARIAPGRVRFHGWLSTMEVREKLSRCAVFAVPSCWPEPFGLTGIEATAMGRSVVASRVGGIPEWIGDESTGCLVESGSRRRELADALNALLADDDRRRAMGECARARVLEEYAPDRHLEKLDSVYADACRKGRA